MAIVPVVFLHCYAEVSDHFGLGSSAMQQQRGLLRLLSHGGYGVEVFFAISGFILALPFARQHLQGSRKVRLASFYLRRLTRLEPPYLLWLLIRTALLVAFTSIPIHFLLVHLAASAFYVHNIAFAMASRIEAVSWTLEIEVQFYCLVPLLTSIYKVSRPWVRRALLAALIAGATPLQWAYLPGWHGPQNAGVFNLSIFASIQFFLAGLLVADLFVDGWERIPASWQWDVASIVLWPLFFWLQPHSFRFLAPVMLPMLFVGAFKGSLFPGLLRHPLISTIGGMCYSIYLTHRTTILLTQSLLNRFHLHFWALLAVSLFLGTISSMVVGAVYFRLIERPCMGLSRNSLSAIWG